MKKARRFGAAALLLLAACSRNTPPELVDAAPPPPPTTTTPNSVSGAYRLRIEIQSGNRPPAQQRNPRRAAPATMVLESQAAAVPVAGAPSGAQFNATVQVPGYTRAPRGRTGQAAAWWPLGADSVVVQFSQGARGEIQLRGSLRGSALSGEIWYLSAETGSSFQLGTFSGTKVR